MYVKNFVNNGKIEKKFFDVTITTINWNVTNLLQKCIDSVLKYCKNVNYVWYIIDNNSQDADFNDIINKYSKYSHLKFIKNKRNEGGLVENKVLKNLESQYILFLQPDVILKNNAIKALIDFMNNNDEAWGATANLLNPDGTLQKFYHTLPNVSNLFFTRTNIGQLFDRIFFSNKKKEIYYCLDLNLEAVTKIEQIGLVCFILHRDFIHEFGGLHEPDFIHFYGDVVICKKIKDKGFKIYLVPSAEVIHDKGSSQKQKKRNEGKWYFTQYRRAQIKYFRKYHRNKLWFVKIFIIFDYLYYFFSQRTKNRKEIIQLISNIIRF